MSHLHLHGEEVLMLAKQGINCLINGNTGVHGRDLIVEIGVVREGEVGRHRGWLS